MVFVKGFDGADPVIAIGNYKWQAEFGIAANQQDGGERRIGMDLFEIMLHVTVDFIEGGKPRGAQDVFGLELDDWLGFEVRNHLIYFIGLERELEVACGRVVVV